MPRVPSIKNSTRTGTPEGTAVHVTEEPLNTALLAILVEMVLAVGGGGGGGAGVGAEAVVAQASLEYDEPPALLKARTR